jgi:hypothetical protein
VATWFWGRYTVEVALRRAVQGRRGWEVHGVDKSMAYDRRTGEVVGRGGVSPKLSQPLLLLADACLSDLAERCAVTVRQREPSRRVRRL